MDERRYRILLRLAGAMTIAWIGWTLYGSSLLQTDTRTRELAAAMRQLEDGQYEQALAGYAYILSLDGNDLGALRGQAQALMQLAARDAYDAHELRQKGQTQAADALQSRARDRYRQALAGYDKAIRRQAIGDDTANERRIQGVTYANRGILKDRMGDYRGALSDYEKSLQLAPELSEGPGFLTRFMRNQAEPPPSVADRARYLRQQLEKPAAERVLQRPEEDMKQRAYRLD